VGAVAGRPSLGDLRGMFDLLAADACTAYNECMQYTIRGIPAAVDNALRERARAAGKSLNEAAVDALAEGSGMAGSRRKRRDLADIARTWRTDKAVEAALADQDRVDEDLWR
jgi:antitoxin FitA-like protein